MSKVTTAIRPAARPRLSRGRNSQQMPSRLRNSARASWKPRRFVEAFGSFTAGRAAIARAANCKLYRLGFRAAHQNAGAVRLGFDVAASGEGDLAAIYIDRKEASRLKLAGLFTCRTTTTGIFCKRFCGMFHRRLLALKICRDENRAGPGKICWETAKRFPGISPPSILPATTRTWASR